MVRKDTNMHHPELVSIRSHGAQDARPARSRDLFVNPYSFRTGKASPAITALTIDHWHTLYAVDGGRDTVRPRRMQALRRALAAGGAHPAEDEMEQAFRSAFDAFMKAWTTGRHYGAHHQVLHFLARFGVDPDAIGEEAVGRAAHEIEEASRSARLELLPGVRETIPALAAAGYRLGIISDTSLTPGRILREFLADDGLLECFSVLTFSDETGYPKPDRRMFETTLAGLDVEPGRAVHVGDTPRTDIAGARAVGMVTIRCAGSADHVEPPQADFVIRDHREIAAILKQLGPAGSD